MENSLPFALYVEEAVESYLAWRKQAIEVQLVLGTQRLLDLENLYIGKRKDDELIKAYPVSRMTLN